MAYDIGGLTIQPSMTFFRRYLPDQARAVLRYYYTQLQLLQASTSDAFRGASVGGGIPIPPARLRLRVHGAVDASTFLLAGKHCADDVQRSLEWVTKDLSSFSDVLDFGCGCGRVLRYFHSCTGPHFYGVDIDPEAIEWCRASLPFGQFVENSISPPLPFVENKFDFVYGISVLTHLNEGHQINWLTELRRITRPGAVLLLTVHGDHATSGLSDTEIGELRDKGFLFRTFRTGRYKLDGLPDFYQSAFHTKDYVYRVWSEYFTVTGYMPRGMNGHQDVVVLAR